MESIGEMEGITGEIDAMRMALEELPRKFDALMLAMAASQSPDVGKSSIPDACRIAANVDDLAKAEAALERARNDHRAQVEEMDALALDAANLDAANIEKKAEWSVLVEKVETLRSECETLGALKLNLEAIRSEASALDERRTELGRLEEATSAGRNEGLNARTLLARLWPSWLLSESLGQWKTELEAKAFDTGAPSSFGMLFAALHGYNASLRDPDPKSLYDNLRDVGRRLYAWLRDLGKSEQDASLVATTWAEAINMECAGLATIQIAVPGNPASNTWMIFAPTGGSSPDVASVRSWCVLDPNKRPMHRAEITV